MSSQQAAQKIQDEIFRKMTAEKKLKLASDFSMFLLDLHKASNKNGISKTNRKNGENS
jgi:hypothetical protein